jgi:hypothetical protein
VTASRASTVAVYTAAYLLAVWAGTYAAEDSDALSAIALFTASAGLLLGVHRECRHAATVIRLGGHRQDPGPDRDTAVAHGTALPPNCRCETWWNTLGTRHHPACPAHPTPRRDHP